MTGGVYFTYGRFNPPTTGHKMMIQRMINMAKKNNATPIVVVSHTKNSNRNPLNTKMKKDVLKAMFGEGLRIDETSGNRLIGKVVDELLSKPGKVTMVIGTDRKDRFAKFMVPKGVRVIGINRNMEKGVSATKVRNAIRTPGTTAKNLQNREYMNAKLSSALIERVMTVVRGNTPSLTPAKRRRNHASA